MSPAPAPSPPAEPQNTTLERIMLELMSAVGFESWGRFVLYATLAVGFSALCVLTGRWCRVPR